MSPVRASFRFRIFPASGLPIYRQLMDQILAQVASGVLAPGAFLPTVRQVAEDLQINPMTVSKAYSLLERDGVLEHCPGEGMRVKSPRTIGSVPERQEVLKPFAEQLVAKAFQLSLGPEEILAVMKPLLQDLKYESKRSRNKETQ